LSFSEDKADRELVELRKFYKATPIARLLSGENEAGDRDRKP